LQSLDRSKTIASESSKFRTLAEAQLLNENDKKGCMLLFLSVEKKTDLERYQKIEGCPKIVVFGHVGINHF
jgi:hypothetical protein